MEREEFVGNLKDCLHAVVDLKEILKDCLHVEVNLREICSFASRPDSASRF